MRRRKQQEEMEIAVHKPACTEAQAHRAAILERFERAVQTRALAMALLNRAEGAGREAIHEHDEARKALRRVAEGAI
jgi:hypothetical protein